MDDLFVCREGVTGGHPEIHGAPLWTALAADPCLPLCSLVYGGPSSAVPLPHPLRTSLGWSCLGCATDPSWPPCAHLRGGPLAAAPTIPPSTDPSRPPLPNPRYGPLFNHSFLLFVGGALAAAAASSWRRAPFSHSWHPRSATLEHRRWWGPPKDINFEERRGRRTSDFTAP